MKKQVLFSCALCLALGMAATVDAQQIYMVAGQDNVQHIAFKELRSLDLMSTASAQVLFSKADLTAQTTKLKANTAADCTCDPGSTNYIAAAAVDAKGNLVTMTMLGTHIYRHLGAAITEVINPLAQNTSWNETQFFARMATTPDGAVYALNNNGSQLLRISADNEVEALGEVGGYADIFKGNDDARVGFGGDMIADDAGKLYVFTAFGYVVKIDVATRSAELLGQLSGLPAGFTVNGAAVLPNNSILLASSSPSSFFVTDLATLKAVYYADNTTPTYDLASPYFVKSNVPQQTSGDIAETNLTIAPTMVKEGRFAIVSEVAFDTPSNVMIYTTDGKLISQQQKVIKAGQTTISVAGLSHGYYFVRVADLQGKELTSAKICIVK